MLSGAMRVPCGAGAVPCGGANNHRELEAWQLAHGLRCRMIALARRPDVKRDLEFCSETVRAANSACRNIAEGFARYKHPQFAHHVNIAIGSLGELFDSNDEARCKGYVSDIEYLELERLVEQARQCAIGLHDYLESTPTPPRKRRRG